MGGNNTFQHSLQLLDSKSAQIVAGLTLSNPTTAITPIPRIDGIPGGTDFALAIQNGSDITTGTGGRVRYDQNAATLSFQTVARGNGQTLPNRDAYRSWYPGFKEGRFQVQNTSGEPIQVDLTSSPQATKGCWFAPGWVGATPFPAGALRCRRHLTGLRHGRADQW